MSSVDVFARMSLSDNVDVDGLGKDRTPVDKLIARLYGQYRSSRRVEQRDRREATVRVASEPSKRVMGFVVVVKSS